MGGLLAKRTGRKCSASASTAHHSRTTECLITSQSKALAAIKKLNLKLSDGTANQGRQISRHEVATSQLSALSSVYTVAFSPCLLICSGVHENDAAASIPLCSVFILSDVLTSWLNMPWGLTGPGHTRFSVYSKKKTGKQSIWLLLVPNCHKSSISLNHEA